MLKSSDLSEISNYRPIIILPHIAKLFDSLIYYSIKRSIDQIICDSQRGFRTGKLVVTSGLVYSTYILDSFETSSQVDVIFTIYKKSFDSVDYSTLSRVIDYLCFGNHFISCLSSYLNSGRQFVSINVVFFDLSIILSGFL